MLTDAKRERIYAAYRARLQAYLDIAPDASSQDIRRLVESGFSAGIAKSFLSSVHFSPVDLDQIIPVKAITASVALGKTLTPRESERLYRFAHIKALAEAIFGCDGKANEWLSKPKDRFSGKAPFSMLSTTVGTRQVEEMLNQLAEGFSF